MAGAIAIQLAIRFGGRVGLWSRRIDRSRAYEVSNLRFSLIELFAVVGLVAVGCVALRNASPLWVSVLCSAMVLSLCMAVVGAIWQDGRRRTASVGFAVAGFLYLVLAFGPGFSESIGTGLPSGVVAEQYVYPLVSREIRANMADAPNGTPVAAIRADGTYVRYPFLPYFTRISHTLGVLFAAVIGGAIARCFVAAARFDNSKKE